MRREVKKQHDTDACEPAVAYDDADNGVEEPEEENHPSQRTKKTSKPFDLLGLILVRSMWAERT